MTYVGSPEQGQVGALMRQTFDAHEVSGRVSEGERSAVDPGAGWVGVEDGVEETAHAWEGG